MTAKINVTVADITELEVDAIVNAANKQLKGGGGVDGAIHRAAGPGLLEECKRLNGCETGDAKVTGGHELPASWVIHAVGPVWGGDKEEKDRLLASCYRVAVEKAEGLGCESLAFPAISTGVYGFPPDRAARVAVAALREALEGCENLKRVILCCFSEESAEQHRRALSKKEG
ncbi:O-acetyl-ADP-ribose deacetylase [Roseovarius sp. SCSIO 43702]|uniref:O-acetyl-ADP-ribose deacetylase n=1 Tax=Roseovarius sp. SCSIO 43702 TaxID=2823043 RepID=UPI001C73AC33|nr:O-acetyl-ADP-ribose deacetylase [Roseovarius sp. SCSIO 43702]QYX55636.1 O-acetyl-ADP-ribose deacetylase [Roseovarius sp. SCSIO 43702]